MKYFYLFMMLQLFFLFPSIQSTTAQNRVNISSKQISHQITTTNYVFSLPFIEDWEYHTFTHNLWEISDDAWAIDPYNGNDGASAKFSGASMQTNYSSTLTSNWLSGANMFVGTVTLQFDLKLTDFAQTGTEFLYVKLFNGTDYFTLDSINNAGSFDWERYEYNISDVSFGNDFKVIFEARGASSTNISGWFVDNIEVFRTCEPPQKLEGTQMWGTNFYNIIYWQAPEILLPPTPWKHWDSGENYSSVGTCPGDVMVAARWEANTLSDVDGDTIKKIRYFISDTAFNYLILHIWTGANAINTIYTDTISNPVAGIWSEHVLSDTLILDASLEYWVGYELKDMMAGTFPLGTDAGPAIAGFGDKISTDGGTWDNMSDFGLNYNWNIEMFVIIPPDTSNQGLSHFIVYKSADMYDYYPIDSVDFVPGQMNYEDKDFAASFNDMLCYKVNAVWGKHEDTCISAFAKSKYNPFEDYYCIMFEGANKLFIDSDLLVYPNPAHNTLTINSESVLLNLTLYDLTGRVVYSEKVSNQNKLVIDISGLTDGMYLLKAETKQGTASRKMIKKGN